MHLAGSSFYDGEVTLLTEPAFLHINTLAYPGRSTRIWLDNQGMRSAVISS